MKRSILAVLAGIVAVVAITTAVDVVLHVIEVYPKGDPRLDDRLSLIASSYRLVIGIFGGWLTARLAPSRPMRHALILGGIGTILGALGAAATWNLGLGPHWYPVSLAVLAIPQSVLGGWIFVASRGAERASS